jgi:CRISPR-associated protein Cmr6
MNRPRGHDGPRYASDGPRQRGSNRRNGDRGGSRRGNGSERPVLPPVWRRNELEPLFGAAMLPPPPAEPNAGLVFDRFLKVWATDTKLVTERREPLAQFAREYKGLGQKLTALLDSTHGRLDAISQSAAGRSVTATTWERFVSGLGARHPLDNGFCFDHVVGVPYLPGSSVKGLCRRMAELEDEPAVRALFGNAPETGDDNEQGTVGDVIFLPAYPASWPELDLDIINCHQQDYYGADPVVLQQDVQKGTRELKRVGPLEIEDPVPVFFLTVAKGTPFVFRCASRTKNDRNVELTIELLRGGLAELGIGAKTALGYGIMKAGE